MGYMTSTSALSHLLPELFLIIKVAALPGDQPDRPITFWRGEARLGVSFQSQPLLGRVQPTEVEVVVRVWGQLEPTKADELSVASA